MKSRFQKGNTQKTRSAFFFGVFTQTTNLKASQSNPQNSSKVRSWREFRRNIRRLKMHLLLPAKDLWLLDLCLRSGKVTGLLGRRFCLSCPVGWLRQDCLNLKAMTCAWGSCMIHYNQVIEHMGRFRNEFLKKTIEKWTVFAGVWRELQKRGLLNLSLLIHDQYQGIEWYWF